MGFAEKEQKRKTRGVVSALAGVSDENGNAPGRGRPKADRETKKRISLAILPSIYDDFGKIAYVDRKSISELIETCLKEHIEKNRDKLKEYDKLNK